MMEDFLYRAGPWATTLAQHNWPLLVYLPLILWVASRAYVRPERRVLLLLYGLVTLALTFEYQKHGPRSGVETVRYLFDTDKNHFAQRVSEFVLVDAAPIAGHALGLSLVVLSVALPGLLRLGRRSPSKSRASTESESGQQESTAPLTPS